MRSAEQAVPAGRLQYYGCNTVALSLLVDDHYDDGDDEEEDNTPSKRGRGGLVRYVGSVGRETRSHLLLSNPKP